MNVIARGLSNLEPIPARVKQDDETLAAHVGVVAIDEPFAVSCGPV